MAIRTRVFGFIEMTRMKLRNRITDFAFDLRAFYAVVEIEIFRRSRANRTDRISRDFRSRVFFKEIGLR